MFELIMQGQEGVQHSLLYDPHSSDMRWADTGEPIDLSVVGRRYERPDGDFQLSSLMGPANPGRKIAEATNIGIQLGLKCNQTCSYCLQGTTDHNIDARPDDIPELLEKIERNLSIGDGDGITFHFRGGEPFLYIKSLKPLAEALRVRYPKSNFTTVSNASLLTPELLDWIEQINLAVTISHDGPVTMKNRGADPLEEEPLRSVIRDMVLRRGRRVSFNAVLSAESNSIRDVRDYIKDKLGLSDEESTELQVNTQGFVSSFSSAYGGVAELSQAARKQWTENVGRLWWEIVSLRSLPLSQYHQRIYAFIDSLAEGRPSLTIGQGCNQDREDFIVFDTKGHVISCHNVSANDPGHHIGDLDDLANVSMGNSAHWSNHSNCLTCPVVWFCKGGCFILKEEDRESFCDDRFQNFMPHFAAALYFLTGGLVLVEIRGEHIRRESITSVPVIDIEMVKAGGPKKRRFIPIRAASS